MSLLRQRATEVRRESTLSERSPALARARLVRDTSCDSDEELKAPASQPRVGGGAASATMDVAAKTSTIAMAVRRGEDAVASSLRTARPGPVVDPTVSDIPMGAPGLSGGVAGVGDTVGRGGTGVRAPMVTGLVAPRYRSAGAGDGRSGG